MAGLAALLLGTLAWGIKTLPAERWQMIAAVPVTKNGNGAWRGLNLTFYGFFSATATVFGIALTIVLLASVGTPLLGAAAVIATMMTISVPASKLVARVIEGKRNTFTIAGAAFVASLILPPGLLLAQRALARGFDATLYVMPLLAAAAIAYALSEAIGRMACLSFGCCYGKPLRQTSPWLARLFGRGGDAKFGVTATEARRFAYQSVVTLADFVDYVDQQKLVLDLTTPPARSRMLR